MKINFNYIKGILVMALVVFLYGFAEQRNNTRKLKEVEVKFTQFENLYITETAVNKLLIQNKLALAGEGKETLDLNKVEAVLNRQPMIENAEVFLTLDGILKTKIQQRRPIGRVLGNSTYYIDRLGDKMPLSSYYSARVPILTSIGDNSIKEVYPLLKYISEDPFYNELVTEISRDNGGIYKLELRKIDFSLFFGKVDRIEEKMNNFKAFYKKALKDDKLNTYKMVDLQFGNQVVCTKK